MPLIAVALHLGEEFLWPGRFAHWYCWYRPEIGPSITTGFLVRINALFVAMAIIAGVLGFSAYGVAIWLVVASIAASNAVFHLWAVLRTKRYSPGVVTGVLVYLRSQRLILLLLARAIGRHPGLDSGCGDRSGVPRIFGVNHRRRPRLRGTNQQFGALPGTFLHEIPTNEPLLP
jgi:hypothetical protein